MTDASVAMSDAEARAAAAESRAVSAEAKLGVVENERNVAVKTAEAAEAGLTQAVGERDTLAHRNEELAREAGRQQGVNEVLKDQIRESQTRAPIVIDQQPVLETLARIENKIGKHEGMSAATATANAHPRRWNIGQVLITIAAIAIIALAGVFIFNMVPKPSSSLSVVTTPPPAAPVVTQPAAPKVITPWAPWNNLPNFSAPSLPTYQWPPADASGTVIYDSPEARDKEMAVCPKDMNPMDKQNYRNPVYASLDEYKSWVYTQCGVVSVIQEAPDNTPDLTDEENQQLLNLMNRTSFPDNGNG